MKKIVFTDEQISDIENDYMNNHLSCETIGIKMGYSKRPIIELLKKRGELKKGKSDGIKIELTENQKEIIKKLYLEDYKNSYDIGETMRLSKPFIDKYLTNCGYRRSVGESISLRQKGKKRSEEVKKILKTAQQKLSKSGKRKQYGGVCKTYDVNGTKCQGTYEKFYIEKLISENKKIPSESKPIITPYGVYNADFYDGENLIEIKSDYTYEVLIGVKKSRWTNKFDLTQYEKIKWINDNVNPVKIIIVDKKNNKLIKKEIL
jgi:hypothetical protein